jgi:hypothetical protein
VKISCLQSYNEAWGSDAEFVEKASSDPSWNTDQGV